MRFFKKRTLASFIATSKSLDRRVSSATVILEDPDGRALIVKASYKSYWTFPGGIIDKGETPKEAALRETFEEVGIIIDPSRLQFVAVVNRKSDVTQTYQFIFKAQLTQAMIDGIILQASEVEDFTLVSKSDVKQAERLYGKVIEYWAEGATGYLDQEFTSQTTG